MIGAMSRPEPQPYAGSAVPRRRSGTQQTTERLLEAAASEFVERGYDAARVSAIARRAGLTPGAVYARWAAKSDVMVAALDYIFEQLLPARQLKDSGVDAMVARDMMELLGTSLLTSNEQRDVMIQVFGSARNNDGIKECLQRYLNQEAHQLSQIVDDGKDAGCADTELSTAAMTLLCQALTIGVHLLLSTGLDSHHVPTEHEWNALITRIVGAVARPDADAP